MFTISLALSFELSPSLASSIFSMALLIGPADPNGLRFSSLNFPNTMKFNIRKVVARVTPNAKTASPTFLIILLEYIFLLIDTRYLCNIQYMPKKVLFIEDDDSFFYTFSIPLNAKGYNVVRVSEGFQAVEKVLVEKPDLIFLDIVLPGVNGLDILKELREKDETKNMKVVMLTNFGTEDNVKRAMELGADDYYSKYNVVPSELPEKVAVLLGETPEESGIKVVS